MAELVTTFSTFAYYHWYSVLMTDAGIEHYSMMFRAFTFCRHSGDIVSIRLADTLPFSWADCVV
jgi:hypothetical protein